jgi:hypothetical protein
MRHRNHLVHGRMPSRDLRKGLFGQPVDLRAGQMLGDIGDGRQHVH